MWKDQTKKYPYISFYDSGNVEFYIRKYGDASKCESCLVFVSLHFMLSIVVCTFLSTFIMAQCHFMPNISFFHKFYIAFDVPFLWNFANSDMHRNHFGSLVTITWNFLFLFCFVRLWPNYQHQQYCQYNWRTIDLFTLE